MNWRRGVPACVSETEPAGGPGRYAEITTQLSGKLSHLLRDRPADCEDSFELG